VSPASSLSQGENCWEYSDSIKTPRQRTYISQLPHCQCRIQCCFLPHPLPHSRATPRQLVEQVGNRLVHKLQSLMWPAVASGTQRETSEMKQTNMHWAAPFSAHLEQESAHLLLQDTLARLPLSEQCWELGGVPWARERKFASELPV
jgi:hypothetical protein